MHLLTNADAKNLFGNLLELNVPVQNKDRGEKKKRGWGKEQEVKQ